MADINTDISTLAGKYILLNDIDLNETQAGFDADTISGWIPIGDYSNRFTGIFNGNGNAITNLWINRTSANYVGLFGIIENAQIKNLTVETAEGKEVKGQYHVGGIAGLVYTSSVTNSYFAGNVNGVGYVGGIAGYVKYSSSITNSHSTGNVSGVQYIGGIVGWVYSSSSITNSYSTSNVSGDYRIGGIAGVVESSSSVTNSHSASNVSGNERVGGIAGLVWSSSVTNSYFAGNVSGNDYVGGIAGYVRDYSSITNNAAINPSVTGSINVNRVTGYIQGGTVTDNFALDDMSVIGSASGDAGISKTELELKTKATYSNATDAGGLGWLFDGNNDTNPWKIDAGNGYPYLYWE
ncbi:MAG: hypothetical protein LBF71_02110 [Campylobacteraceae bacterium]|nr:hypothetical protein [Campylobacteraceae bacterium]